VKEILLTNKYSGTPLQIAQAEVPDGFCIRFLPEQTQEELIREAANAEYILGWWISF